ncbi:MAG: undecaprenyl-diphosphate phosphatase [Gemmataceae bacterium]|nr:undecaprenyl-diphosphate phosphatase [Gemmataceae bacterium]
MNDYVISLILGVIEGLTEFLPVSSTAHLRIAQAWLGLDMASPYWKGYSVIIQLGAILSVVVYFRTRLLEFVRTFPRGRNGDRTIRNHPLTLVFAAFVVTAGPAYLLEKLIDDRLENLLVLGGALIVGGFAMAWVDAAFTKPRTDEVEQMTLIQAAWIGAVQILSAVFPGTSRSMATIAAGQVAGLSRTTALEFSFFLSIPIMFAATGLKLVKMLMGGFRTDAHGWGVLAAGMVVSFVTAIVVIHGFMNWVRRGGFWPFAIYRILLGAAVIAYAMRAV